MLGDFLEDIVVLITIAGTMIIMRMILTTQVGEYLERMARYDLMLGVTSAEAFVLLNQEVFNVYIKNDAFVYHPPHLHFLLFSVSTLPFHQ